MIEGWQSEGVGTSRIIRITGKLPGLYAIRTSDQGERSFYYWRDNAAARMLLDLPQTDDLLAALDQPRQGGLGALVDAQQRDHFPDHLVFRGALEIQCDRTWVEELAEAHWPER